MQRTCELTAPASCLHFHPLLPKSAMRSGVDGAVASTHKVLGAITQSAILNVQGPRVDLGRLSILTLTDQLVTAIESGEGRIPLERRADWLVMASGLLLLKAQLLAPSSPEEAEDARATAARRAPVPGGAPALSSRTHALPAPNAAVHPATGRA